MAELSVAEQYYKEGKYLDACQAYDILLNDDPNNINLLQAQANCFMSLYQWHDCFQSILKAFQCSSWDLTLLNSFVANLVDKLNVRRRGLMEKESIKDRQINEFEENLVCEYCHQVFCNPVTFSCGHTFCKQCMLKSKKCLHCNNSIEKPEDVSVNVVLTTIIGNCFQAKMKAVKLRREGNEYFFDKKYEDALNKYTKALHLDPSNHFILGNLSHVYSVLGEYQTALDYAERSCNMMPNWQKGFYRKAQAYIGLKNYSQAAVYFLKALLIDPQSEVFKSFTKAFVEILRDSSKSTTMLDDVASCLDGFIQGHGDTEQGNVSSVEDVSCVLSEKLRITDLECSLCCGLYYNPVTCPCGHTFCQWCLNRCLDHKPVCPVCRCLIKENVTRSTQAICYKYFPENFQERKQQHEKEVNKLASVALDTDEDIPVFVCTLAFPTIPCTLHIFEPRYRLMIRECMESGSRQFGMCCPTEDDSFSDYGVMLEIEDFELLPDGRSRVKTVGGRRFKVLNRGMKDGYHTAKVEWLKDETLSEEDTEFIRERQQYVYGKVVSWFLSLSVITKFQLFTEMAIPLHPPACDYENIAHRNGPKWMWWSIQLLPIATSLKLQIISITDIRQRLDKIEECFDENTPTM